MAAALQQHDENVMVKEDGDSRDSGISSCETIVAEANVVDFSKIEATRHALTDCSNFVPKVAFNSSVSSSRSSSFFHCDTPTGRKTKSVFYSDALDHSQYEKKTMEIAMSAEKIRKRHSTSTSPNSSRVKSKRIRDIGPQSDKVCRYNTIEKQNKHPFEDDDDVFFGQESSFLMPPPSKASVSAWEVGSANLERKSSDTSADSSFQEKPHLKPIRAMSVGVINPDHSHLPSMLEVKYNLPSVERPQKASQAYRSISPITLLSEFQRLGPKFSEQYIVIDCRYPYEFSGGHVRGAINLYKPAEIKEMFFPDAEKENVVNKRIPIFYCEFSQKRGPTMANTVRSIDRVRNELRYPHVEYPEMYLLDHGYKSLWNRNECRQICEPCDYVPMDHKQFTKQLKTARLERHQSQASVKPNGELEEESKRSMRTRSAIRRKSSVVSLLSKFSQSSSSISVCSSQLLTTRGSGYGDEVFYTGGDAPKKSVSAFDITSIGTEVDVDPSFARPIPSTSSIIEEEHVVQLGVQVITPDFPSRPTDPMSPFIPIGRENEHHNTPRACLNFSYLSDTD